MADNNNLIVYCEFDEGNIADVSLELLTKGRQLATQLGVRLEALVVAINLPASKAKSSLMASTLSIRLKTLVFILTHRFLMLQL